MLKQKIDNLPYGLTIREMDCASIDSAVAAQLHDLLAEHQLLVFEDQQQLTPNQEVAFYEAVNPDCHSIWRDQKNNPWERFKVEQGNKAGTYQIPDAPGVLVLGKGDINHHGLNVTLGGDRSAYGKESGSQVLGGGALQWHIDGTFYEHHPCRMTQMRCVEAPSGEGHWIDYNDGSGDRLWCEAGATAFASGRLAFELLTEEDQRACLQTSVHYASKPFQVTMHEINSDNGLRVLGGNESDDDLVPPPNSDPLAKVYPLVWFCDQTKMPALMPHPRCMQNLVADDEKEIMGLSASRLRVESLMRAGISSQHVYVHNWKPGDLVLWNNHAVWHSATGQLSPDDRRVMHLTAFNASVAPRAPAE